MISCLGREDSIILTFADICGLCDIDQEFSYSKKSKNFRSPRIDYTVKTIYRIDYIPYSGIKPISVKLKSDLI